MSSTRNCLIAAVIFGFIGLSACSRGRENPPPATVSSPDTDAVPPPETPEKAVVAPTEPTEPAVPPPTSPRKSSAPSPVTSTERQPSKPLPATKTPAPIANAPTSAPKPANSPPSSSTSTAAASSVSVDLAGLEKQLKSTKAIGVFSKIALKNQVDDLMKQFRDHYKGKAKPTMAELRQTYDLLMMKVLSMVQDEDKNLAASIVASRAAIWELLADPEKFAALDA